ncbi:MAG TPA: type II toxin-antitoxin system VapC family toxin [Terracidiphilus sp.]|nr:type II toxin-antitoxin system VapC family toxin [Terracidiphilus sp.]
MIVDSSAIIAILKREPRWQAFSKTLDSAATSRISAANYLETSIVVDGWRNPILSREFDELIERFNILIEPVTVDQAKISRQAYRDYGRGSGHPAKLNFGDCFTYALAREKREPVLWKGDDFGLTDLRPALQTP